MIGVVVWSNSEREKAVIWCEDQGALAYLNGFENLAALDEWPLAGDLVELESEMLGNLRHARKVGLVTRQHFAELPAMLTQEAPVENTSLRLAASNGHAVERSACQIQMNRETPRYAGLWAAAAK